MVITQDADQTRIRKINNIITILSSKLFRAKIIAATGKLNRSLEKFNRKFDFEKYENVYFMFLLS